MSQSFKRLATALACVTGLFAASTSFAAESTGGAGAYIGVLGGWGFPLAIDGLKSEPVLGATIGYKILPELAIAAMWQHDYFKTDTAPLELDAGMTQWMGEANFFSFFNLNGGLHAGVVKSEVGLGGLSVSSSDFGFGAHLGQDFGIAPNLTLGVEGYYTYVKADDAFSIVNVLVPLKYIF